jgi:hypothetical protein
VTYVSVQCMSVSDRVTSTLKTEAVSYSETLVPSYHTILNRKLEDQYMNFHQHKNIKSDTYSALSINAFIHL